MVRIVLSAPEHAAVVDLEQRHSRTTANALSYASTRPCAELTCDLRLGRAKIGSLVNLDRMCRP
jgi:hypothetical protein